MPIEVKNNSGIGMLGRKPTHAKCAKLSNRQPVDLKSSIFWGHYSWENQIRAHITEIRVI